VNGAEAAVGWGAVNGLGRLEMRLGVGRLLSRVPGGIAAKLVGYALKIVNVGLVSGLARKFTSARFANYATVGGVTNLGVNVIADLSGMFGAQGEMARGLLKGHGDVASGLSDYVLYGQPYNTAMGLSDYRDLTGQMSMGDVVGVDPYGEGAY